MFAGFFLFFIVKHKVKVLFYFLKKKKVYTLLGKRVTPEGESFWWLPGGSAEGDENTFEALKRELEEELILPESIQKALSGQHKYPSIEFKGKNYNQVYLIEVPPQAEVPEIQEEFVELKWFTLDKLPENMSREYASFEKQLQSFFQ